MVSNYTFLDNNGTVIADTSNLKSDIQAEYQTALGPGLSLEDSTPQGRLIDIETDARAEVLENNTLIANSINFKLAFGIILDAWGANFGLSRKAATSSSVTATITGVAGTTISAGSQASTQAGEIFYLENQITIPVSGSINATFLSLEKGEVPCPANSLTKIIDGTLGWETINNTSAATLGTLRESDESFKQKFYDAGLFTGMSLIEDYDNAIMSVDNVISARVIDNGSSSSKVIDANVTIDPHSVYACVDGGNNDDVANALFHRKSSGSAWTALSGQDVTVNVIDATYGDTYTVIFNRPVTIDIYSDIVLSAGTNTSDTLEDDIKSVINDYINAHKIGEGLTILQLAQVINSTIPGVDLTSINIGTDVNDITLTNVSALANEVVKSQLTDITVTING